MVLAIIKKGSCTNNHPLATINFTIYDYLITTNRDVDGRYSQKTKDALDRLRSINITTNIETEKTREAQGFGLVDA